MNIRFLAPVFFAAFLASTPAPAQSDMSREQVEAIVASYIKAHPDEIGAIVKDYVLRHPEVLREIFVELNRRKAPSPDNAAQKPDPLAGERAQKIGANAQSLFSSPHQATLGDPNGDVTLVEFFDYNCGYCKRALADTVALLGEDAHLRLALKVFPFSARARSMRRRWPSPRACRMRRATDISLSTGAYWGCASR